MRAWLSPLIGLLSLTKYTCTRGNCFIDRGVQLHNAHGYQWVDYFDSFIFYNLCCLGHGWVQAIHVVLGTREGAQLRCPILAVVKSISTVSYQLQPKSFCIVLCWDFGCASARQSSGGSPFRRTPHRRTQRLAPTSGNEAAWLKMHSLPVLFNWISSSCTPALSPPPSHPIILFLQPLLLLSLSVFLPISCFHHSCTTLFSTHVFLSSSYCIKRKFISHKDPAVLEIFRASLWRTDADFTKRAVL